MSLKQSGKLLKVEELFAFLYDFMECKQIEASLEQLKKNLKQSVPTLQ